MKRVLIEIPDEFENDLEDKFNDFFGRVKADLGDCSEALLCGNYEMETIDMFLKSFDSSKVLSGKTNGDVIKTLFNCMVIEISNGKVYVEGIYFPFDEEWWNAPYKVESEK